MTSDKLKYEDSAKSDYFWDVCAFFKT